MKLTEQNGLRILTPEASDGWLTDGEVYSQEVYLGSSDTPDRWREITADEYEDLTATDEDKRSAFVDGLMAGYAEMEGRA